MRMYKWKVLNCAKQEVVPCFCKEQRLWRLTCDPAPSPSVPLPPGNVAGRARMLVNE